MSNRVTVKSMTIYLSPCSSMVEHQFCKLGVVGSSPTWGSEKLKAGIVLVHTGPHEFDLGGAATRCFSFLNSGILVCMKFLESFEREINQLLSMSVNLIVKDDVSRDIRDIDVTVEDIFIYFGKEFSSDFNGLPKEYIYNLLVNSWSKNVRVDSESTSRHADREGYQGGECLLGASMAATIH